MAIPGTKPLPESVKRLRGTLEKSRILRDQLRPQEGPMELPQSDLPKRVEELFDHYAAMFTRLRISSEVFTPVVLELAIRMFEIEELTKDLTEKGFILENYYKDGNLIRKANPSFKLRSDALRHLTQLLAESGMTPSAATRVRKLQKDEPTTPTGFAALD